MQEHIKVLRRFKEKERCFHFKALARNHARESLHLEKKNMLRTFFRAKTEKSKNIATKGFLQF